MPDRLDELLAAAGITASADDAGDEHRSGFVTILGRPNVGKSALVNTMTGTKVSIVTDKPHTTRFAVRGVLTRPEAQLVFVDTPGLHRPRTKAGERFNEAATNEIADVDVVCVVVDATMPIGRGDAMVAERAGRRPVVVVNKIDKANAEQVLSQLAAAAAFDGEAYFPVSARSGEGVEALVEHLVARMPRGPRYYPVGMTGDLSDAVWVAELVREQLMARTRQELPHSVATRVTEWDWPRVRCEIVVERDSQKGMVIGKGGLLLKEVGTEVRRQMPGMHLELFVRVAPDWQRRPELFDRLGM